MEDTLKESEEKYKVLFEVSADGILIADSETMKFLYGNPAICKMLGYSETEIQELGVKDIHPKDSLEHVISEFEAQVKGKKTLAENIPFLRKDGTILYTNINTTAALIDGRKCNVGFFRDITERKQSEKTLRQERRIQKYLDIAGVMLVAINTDGIVTLINKKGCEILGYNEEEIVCKNWFDNFVPKRAKEAVLPVSKQLLAGEIEPAEYYENPVLTKNGEERLIAWHNTILKDDDGNIIGHLSSGEDITERKKAEEELKESEERYRILFEVSADGILIADVETKRFLFANPAVCTMLQHSEEELKEMSVDDIHPKGNLSDVFAEFEAQAKGKKTLAENIPCLCKDGGILYADVNTTSMFIDGRKYNIGLFRDITERKKAEEALKESEERFKALAENSPDVISRQDKSTRYLYVNPAVKKVMGVSAESMIGKTNSELGLSKELEDFWQKKIDKVYKTKKAEVYETKSKFYTREKYFQCISVPEFNSQGKISSILTTARDITERKKAEQEVIRTKEYLKSIINSASEIIIAFNRKGKVTIWNKTAELLTGCKQREVIGMDINKLDLFDNPQELLDNIKSVYDKNEPRWDELVLRTKKDTNRIIRLSYSVIKGEQEQGIGVLIIGENITDEREEHGKLLRGKSYLICDKNNRSALHLFGYLTRSNYNGLYATRADPSNIGSLIDLNNNQVILFSQDKLREFEHISDLDELTVAIKEFTIKHTNSVILLDRIDYFLNRFSFEQFIDSLYKINDIVSNNKAILLVYLNPSFMDTNQLSMIEEELHQLPGHKIDSILIEDELYDILKFVYTQNQKNSMVFFKKISTELLVDKKTVSKRLKILTDQGLVSIKKQGRLKTVYLSEKGKALFFKRQVA